MNQEILYINDQEILCALGNICYSETPDKESFSRVAKFYKINGEIQGRDSGSRAENIREFSSCARIRLHDCFRNAGVSVTSHLLILKGHMPTL